MTLGPSENKEKTYKDNTHVGCRNVSYTCTRFGNTIGSTEDIVAVTTTFCGKKFLKKNRILKSEAQKLIHEIRATR